MVAHGNSVVTVHIGPVDYRLGFYIGDAGAVLPLDIRKFAFEAGATTGEDDAYCGMGLVIVRGIAGTHGWDVTLTDAISGGAWFEFADDRQRRAFS